MVTILGADTALNNPGKCVCGWVNFIFYGKDQFGGVRFFFVDVYFCKVKAVFWW